MGSDLVAQWAPDRDPSRPLVVAIHGYGAQEGDLVRLQPFLGAVDLVALRAPLPVGSGFCWFPLAEPGVPDPATVTTAAGWVQDWIDTHAADRDVVLLGFSQGGTTALQTVRHRPDRYRGVVLLSGFVAPGDVDGDAQLETSPVPVFWGRDVQDPIIAPVAIERTAAWLPGHTTATVRTYPGILHGIGRAELDDVRAFLGELTAVVPDGPAAADS
ncbi:hypothetical protein GIS00_07455 [Nakamurella sp. YIM 132087]|uniref:Phospholipase/carboxylesterase/thioesterase domain-containing protein n=1 Tax=Nakamurella alba TaxID=2665158 RepID=A0A7K1FK28_9ACTN|nr:alpha/beta fold hydrolase [Nakamurella alba]MTD13779.1 hypothetical protein [Nakamurella alba]